MKLSVGETTKLLGISVRTLHYYDEIGLVKPSVVTEAGYRYYDNEALSKLQQIMFYKELEFSLKEIAHFFNNPKYDKFQALKSQRELLVLKQHHINELISIIDNTIGGENYMEKRIGTTANDIALAKKKYAEEARERWGETKEFEEFTKKQEHLSEKDIKNIASEADMIFSEFAANVDKSPDNETIQDLVSKWQQHICKYYYECSNETLSCLGEMYINDERFKNNLDSFGEGTAKLMSDAIKMYCKN